MKLTKLTKAALYEVIKEEGYLLPKLTSTACRVSYLVSVRAGNEYCPRAEEVQAVYCENPPKRMVMLQIMYEELKGRGDVRSLSFDEKHLPDVDWCLSALSALNPDHPIFEPGYMPSNEIRGRRGRRYIPEAEELVYMIDFQSAISQKKSEQSNSKTVSSGMIIPNVRSYQELRNDPHKGLLFKPDLQSEIGKLKNPYSGHKHEKESFPQQRTAKQENSNVKTKSTDSQSHIYNVKKKILNSSQDRISSHLQNESSPVAQRQSGPLLNMLKQLESKGLLDECMIDYIKIQQEYEKRSSSNPSQTSKIQKRAKQVQMEQQVRQVLNLQGDSKKPCSPIKHQFNNALVNDAKQVACQKFEEDTYISKGCQANPREQTYIRAKNAQTMNQLMDESQMNPMEYEEVAFQDLIEENENFCQKDYEKISETQDNYQQLEEQNQQPDEKNQVLGFQLPSIIHIV